MFSFGLAVAVTLLPTLPQFAQRWGGEEMLRLKGLNPVDYRLRSVASLAELRLSKSWGAVQTRGDSARREIHRHGRFAQDDRKPLALFWDCTRG